MRRSTANRVAEFSSLGTFRQTSCPVTSWYTSLIAVVVTALAATPCPCHSAILTVTEDGSGGYATLWEALEVVENGDEIWVGPGYLDESTDDGQVRELSLWGKSFTIRGQGSGPDATTIAYLKMYLSGNVVIENVTFTSSCSPLTLQDWESPAFALEVRNCIFRDNGLDGCSIGGAAIETRVNGDVHASSVVIEDSIFEGHDSSDAVGGTIYSDADLRVTNSVFVRNSCGGIWGATMEIDGCLFWDNVGNAIIAYGEHDIRNSTFWHNEAQSAIYTISGHPDQSKIRNCIIGRTIGGYGLECTGWVEVTCCLLSFNDLGNWGHCVPLPNSGVVYDVDPMFCDEDTGDFALRPDSPCLPGFLGGRECELIGAYPLGCGVSPTVGTSWGLLKLQFR